VFLLTDNTFKKSVLHQLLTIKYEMRSMDEKINVLLKLAEDEKYQQCHMKLQHLKDFLSLIMNYLSIHTIN